MKCTGLRRNATTVSVMKYKHFSPALVSDKARNKSRLKPKLPESVQFQAHFVDTQFQVVLMNKYTDSKHLVTPKVNGN